MTVTASSVVTVTNAASPNTVFCFLDICHMQTLSTAQYSTAKYPARKCTQTSHARPEIHMYKSTSCSFPSLVTIHPLVSMPLLGVSGFLSRNGQHTDTYIPISPTPTPTSTGVIPARRRAPDYLVGRARNAHTHTYRKKEEKKQPLGKQPRERFG
jgi:hypothetical protein